MSWLEVLYITFCAMMFIIVFLICDDETLGVRFATALAVAFFWLPVLILFVLMLLVDGLASLIVRMRQ